MKYIVIETFKPGGKELVYERFRRPGGEPSHNRNAYTGGVRRWETDPRTKRPKWNVI